MTQPPQGHTSGQAPQPPFGSGYPPQWPQQPAPPQQGQYGPPPAQPPANQPGYRQAPPLHYGGYHSGPPPGWGHPPQGPQRKSRVGLIVGGVALLLVAALAVGLMTFLTMRRTTEAAPTDDSPATTAPATTASTTAPTTPPNATDGFGILVQGKEPVEGVPHVVIWEDPQCPACAHRDTHWGPIVQDLVADGSITAEVRFAYFLDGHGVEDGPSHHAARAAAAADQVGAFDAFHEAMFAAQASGYSEQALRENIPQAAGISGDDLDEFQRLVDADAFYDFTVSAHEKFISDNINATPTYLVSGERLEFFGADEQVLIPPEAPAMLEAIENAFEAGGRQHES